ncbi:hypothetical protein [Calothrix sp. CCY 0018]|uniref:hypothetical protein n=1 Tax=Calothrix sp. CCY 0018 TaxID=3103864 RepID=UPI0039C6275E
MGEQTRDRDETDISEFQEKSFQYQLDCLKLEIDLVDRSIARLETITQNVKNFSVVIWVASITIFLGQNELRKYVIVTALMPILFWFIDAWWMHFHRGAFLRMKKIKQFLNSDDLVKSFEQQSFVNFSVLDVQGEQYKGTQQYEIYTNVWRIMRYKELLFLYLGLAITSLIIEAVVLLTSK